MKHVIPFVLCAASAASAQTINIDFGTVTNAAPPMSFAAAGQAGHWNNLTSLSSTPVGGFLDSTGNPVALSISSSRQLFAVMPSAQPFSGPMALLLGDYLVAGQNDFTLSFSGLVPGTYRVITYTVGRQDFPYASTVTPLGDPSLTRTNTGVWAGSLQEGVTHSLHSLVLTTGNLSLNIFSPANAFVTGMQFVLIPSPSVVMCLFPCALLGVRRSRPA